MPRSVSRRLPNLLILGAAKSGTTWLHRQLDKHPQVFMSAVKEPTFFTNSFHVTSDAAAYADLFDDVTDERWIGESSHAYLTHPESLRTVATFLDPEKFIVSLRDPITRARSLFNHQSRQGWEWSLTFEAGLRKEPRRMRSTRLRDSRLNSYMNLAYVTSGNYAEQLKRYFDVFGREKFHIVFFEDLADRPSETLDSVCAFLDLEPLPEVRPPANVGGAMSLFAPISLGLFFGGRGAPPPIDKTFQYAFDRFHRPAPPLKPQTRARLEAAFRPGVAELEDLLQRQVPWDWVRPT